MLVTIKNNEKFYLTFWEMVIYSYNTPEKQMAYKPYFKAENICKLFFRGKGGGKRRTFICRI